MSITDPNHWKEGFADKGDKYDKILEIIASLNAQPSLPVGESDLVWQMDLTNLADDDDIVAWAMAGGSYEFMGVQFNVKCDTGKTTTTYGHNPADSKSFKFRRNAAGTGIVYNIPVLLPPSGRIKFDWLYDQYGTASYIRSTSLELRALLWDYSANLMYTTRIMYIIITGTSPNGFKTLYNGSTTSTSLAHTDNTWANIEYKYEWPRGASGQNFGAGVGRINEGAWGTEGKFLYPSVESSVLQWTGICWFLTGYNNAGSIYYGDMHLDNLQVFNNPTNLGDP